MGREWRLMGARKGGGGPELARLGSDGCFSRRSNAGGSVYSFGFFAVTREIALRACSSPRWVWKWVVVKLAGLFRLKIQ